MADEPAQQAQIQLGPHAKGAFLDSGGQGRWVVRWQCSTEGIHQYSEIKRWATAKNLIGITLLLGGLVLRLNCVGKYDDPWASLRVVAQICVVLGALVLCIPGKSGFGDFPRRRSK